MALGAGLGGLRASAPVLITSGADRPAKAGSLEGAAGKSGLDWGEFGPVRAGNLNSLIFHRNSHLRGNTRFKGKAPRIG